MSHQYRFLHDVINVASINSYIESEISNKQKTQPHNSLNINNYNPLHKEYFNSATYISYRTFTKKKHTFVGTSLLPFEV